MKGYNQNDPASKQAAVSPPIGKKPPWQRPIMVLLGKFGDLVKGGGKTGGHPDSDPLGTQKQGVG